MSQASKHGNSHYLYYLLHFLLKPQFGMGRINFILFYFCISNNFSFASLAGKHDNTNAEFTLHDLALIFTRRQIPEIGGKSLLVHASHNRAVWIIKDTI